MKKKRKKRFLKSKFFLDRAKFIKAFLIILVSCAPFLIFIYLSAYSNKAYPNIYFDSINLGGKPREEISQMIFAKTSQYETENFEFLVDDKKISIPISELGISFDVNETTKKALKIGRSGSPTRDFLTSISLLFKDQTVTPIYLVDFSAFSTSINRYIADFEEESKDASVVFKNNEIVVLPEEQGRVIDRSLIIASIKENVTKLSNRPILVLSYDQKPDIFEADTTRAVEQARSLIKKRIVFSNSADTYVLSGSKLYDLLKFSTGSSLGSDGLALNLGSFDVTFTSVGNKNPADNRFILGLDDFRVDEHIAQLASSIDRQKVDATLLFEGGKVSAFAAARDGQELDRAKTKELLLSAISSADASESGNIAIALPVKITNARIANDEINSLGIKELIGRGVSYFAGSIPNRISNIELGSKLISGALIAPGEVFSFDNLVGPVSAQQGFKQAYVISKGRTVLDDGGGICQVSTTVFRAVLDSGLPILERTAHAYRVAYYEQRGSKPGLDATIWSPSVDLKFKNDTANHILLQAVVDRVNAKLEVDLYGTRDSRMVEISTPVVANQVPPPQPLYQEDPALPRGTTKQVDFAAWGANVSFSRKVYKGDAIIIDEIFKSSFKPWQAVYLVGTGG